MTTLVISFLLISLRKHPRPRKLEVDVFVKGDQTITTPMTSKRMPLNSGLQLNGLVNGRNLFPLARSPWMLLARVVNESAIQ